MNLKKISNDIRKNIIIMNTRANASHSGTALSIVDILTVLYYKVMNNKPEKPDLFSRDKFLLSKGHGSTALYSVLAEKGYFSKKLLETFHMDGGKLPGHLNKDVVPGIEISSGSLGHGLSLGVGMALSNRIGNLKSHVYVLCGDGELNEGSMWEAIMFAGHHKLTGLTLVVDYNKLQGYGRVEDVLNLEPIYDKFKAFNWDVFEVDGHNYDELEKLFLQKTSKSKVIIAHTIKGRGISYMENEFIWHYKSPSEEELQLALKELS